MSDVSSNQGARRMMREDFVAGPHSLSNRNLPFVSVIVIVLNMDTTIGSCLSALERLDYPKDRYEIIVVDNGSTDKTLDIVKKFDVKLLKENRKIRGLARNHGIRHAKGSIIAFTDADCNASTEWLRFHVCDHLAHPEAAAVGGGLVHKLSKHGRFTDLLVADNEIEHSVNAPMRYVSTIGTGNASFKKFVIARIGLFNERLHIGEDAEICHRIGMHGYKILFDPRASIVHLSFGEYWTHSDIHRLATDFIRGGADWFGVEKTQPKRKYRLPHDAIIVLTLFFPIVLLRGFRILYKMRYMVSLKTLEQVPYVAFGSFFWTLGYFGEAWRANKSAMRDESVKSRTP